MNKGLLVLFLISQSLSAMASDQSNCQAAGGSFLTGVVTSAPKFQRGSKPLQGVMLSHTTLNVKSDQDGKSYQVAMDNVFAADYVKNSSSSPNSLAAIKLGDHLELCGALYAGGSLGIHWVHNNCNAAPSASHPNGWVEELAADGTAGVNLESGQAYCYLWGG